MFKCRDCKEYFDEPKIYVDWVEFWGSNVSMESYECPCCGSSDFDEADIVEEEEEDDEEEDEE